jgi:hypothetical protein
VNTDGERLYANMNKLSFSIAAVAMSPPSFSHASKRYI